MLEIRTNVAEIADNLRRIADGLGADLSALMDEVMQKALVDTQENIRSQGRLFGAPWEPPSKWIIAKKGHGYKILEGQEKNLRILGSGLDQQLVFQSPVLWTLTSHNDGFRVLADLQEYGIPISAPDALSLPAGSTSFKFRWGRDSVVPARKIWMDENDALTMVHPLIENFKMQMEHKLGGGL